MVTVIIPAYNASKYIEMTIASVQAQTYTDLDILVVDDCSCDCTVSQVKTMAMLDKRLRIIELKYNQGVAAARNIGINDALGEWIAFIDSDDIWQKDKIVKQLATAKNSHGDFVYTGSSFIDADGDPLPSLLHVPESMTYKMLLKQNLISCSSILIKKDLMLAYPMPERSELVGTRYEVMHEDYPVWLQILRSGKIAYGIDEPLLKYRMTVSSRSGDKRQAALMTWRVYRYIGLNTIYATYCWICYAIRSMLKYREIIKR